MRVQWLAIFSVFILVSSLAKAQPSSVSEDSQIIEVETASGRLSGSVENGVAAFKGIPYAKPPVGDLRWAATETIDPWEGTRDAMEFPAPCAQPFLPQDIESDNSDDKPWVFQSEGAFAAVNADFLPGSSEDCLYLNIWSRVNDFGDSDLPVMLWFHGGSGSSAEAFFDGTNFAKQGIVLVTFNRRMSTLGSFSHPALTAEAEELGVPLIDYSQSDQLEALKWIRNNIAAFGGDKDNITVFGQSAGGAAIEGLLTTRQAEGLFHKAIIQSGSGFRGTVTHAQHEELGIALLDAEGLEGANLTAKELREIPLQQLPWAGVSVRRDAESAEDIETQRFYDIPMIIGWNSFDGSSLRFPAEEMLANTPTLVRAIYEEQGLAGDDLIYSIYTDRRNGAPAKWLATQTSSGSPSYLYHFDYVLTLARRFVRGAEHGREVIHVFDNWLKTPPEVMPNIKALIREDDLEMSRTLQECWVNFAKSGVPSCANTPVWNAFVEQTEEVMVFGTTNRVETGFREKELDVQFRHMQDTINNRRNDYERLMVELERISDNRRGH